MLVAALVALHHDHVLYRDALGDAHAVLDPGVGRLHDGVGRERGRHEHDAGGGIGGRHGLLHGVEDPQATVGVTTPAGRDPAHHIGAVGEHLGSVERGDAAGDALHQHRSRLVEDDAHQAALRSVAAAAFVPASASESAVITGTWASARMRRPSSTLVPDSRTTTGTEGSSC